MSNPTNTGAPTTAAPVQTVNAAGNTITNLPSGHASLYVGDLDEEVTEAAIYEKFSQIGTILSIRVCRDMITRRSLGYAYVNLSTPAEAEKAIDALNFDTLNNRQMRIMWSQRDPSLRKSGVGNIFIKNLDKSIQVRELYDTFSTFGDILSCKIATDEKGISKGYGFIHFSSKEAAETAIARLHGMNLKDKTIFVAPFVPRSQRSNQGSGDQAFNNVFIKNFGDDMNDQKLKAMFNEFGEMTSVYVAKNDDGTSKGFGFVCFKDPEGAKAAVAAKNSSDFGGRSIFVGRAMKKTERTEQLRNQFERKKADKTARYAVGVNLYVKNLDDSIDDDTLRHEFAQHGNITSVKVMRDQSGRSKGFGFVCFSYPDEATKAVTEMNGKLLCGKPLYVALAQRKEERHARLHGEFVQRQMVMRAPMSAAAFQGGALPQSGMNAHPAFAGSQMGAAMNMYQFNQLQANAAANSAMNASHGGFFPAGFPPRAMFQNTFPNMSMQAPRQATAPRWGVSATGFPGGAQPGMRPVGGPAGYPQAMMRPGGMPQSAIPQQRFMSVPTAPGQAFVGGAAPQQQQQRVVGPSAPGQLPQQPNQALPQAAQQQRMSGPVAGAPPLATHPAQVQYTMTARNIQPPTQQNQQAMNATGAGARMVGQGANPQQVVNNTMGGGGAEGAGRREPFDSMSVEQFVKAMQNTTADEQKNMLGERLYSMIKQWHPDLVGKLTGMLLEIDSRELLGMIVEHHRDIAPDMSSQLRKKVDSAYQVLLESKPHADAAPKKDGDSA